jgi:tape measure domain-containing protein
MSDFPINIKIDNGGVEAKIKGVESALAGAEARGKTAGQAMLGVSGAFKTLGQAIEQEKAALQRSTEIHDRLTGVSGRAAQGFAKMAEAIKTEQNMLEKIHGPAKRYAEDLQTLDSLLEKNKISTQQYADEVANLNRQHESAPTPGGPGLGSSLGALAGVGAAGGAVLAIGQSIEAVVENTREFDDRFIHMSNRALQFATDGKTLNNVLGEQRILANDLNSTMEPTIDLFDGISDATRNYNLTNKETIALSKTLGEEMINNNQPIDRASELVQKLAVALEIGSGAGRQFKTIMSEYPGLSVAAAKGFGVTEAQLEEMVDTGKVKLPELLQAIQKNGDAIHEQFMTHAKDSEQIGEQIADNIAIFRKQGSGSFQAEFEAGSEKLHDFNMKMREGFEVGKPFADVLGEITTKVKDQVTEWHRIDDAATGAHAAFAMNEAGLFDLAGGLDHVSFLLGKVGDALNDNATNRALGIGQARAHEVHEAKIELEGLTDAYKAGEIPLAIYTDRSQALSDTINGVTSASRAAAKAEATRHAAFVKMAAEEIAVRNRVLPHQETLPVASFGMITPGPEMPGMYQHPSKEFEKGLGGIGAAVKAQDDLTKKSEENARRVQEAWAQGLGSIAADFISMAAKGEMSFSDLASSAAKLALQMAAMQMGGPGGSFLSALAGGIGGFATGGSFTVPGGPGAYLPRAWSGNDWQIGGSGGTDSKLVAFMGTPGETVHVRTPSQQVEEARRGGGGTTVVQPIVEVREDPRQLAQAGMSGRAGERIVARVNRRLNGYR